jgi:hypothetical protein
MRKSVQLLSVVFFLAAPDVAAGAQSQPLVAPGSSLAVTARLRTSSVDLVIPLDSSATLVPLSYHPRQGWTPTARLDRLPGRAPGSHTVRFPRRLGKLDVPNGTENGMAMDNPDPMIGCSAAGGVPEVGSGHCSLGGSSTFGIVLDVPIATSDYRAAIIRVDRQMTSEALKAALAVSAKAPPVDGLRGIAAALGTHEAPAAWALVRVPRAP